MVKQKQKHIAMLIGALSRGGSERVLVNLADYFVKQGYRVTMVTQYKRETEYALNDSVKRIISDILPEETSKNRITNFKRRYFKLRNIWKQQKPDVILSFIGKNNMMAILTSCFTGIPVAVSVRGEPAEEYYNKLMRLLAKCLFRLADGVILQTGRCMEFFPRGIRKKAIILKNPVNPQFFREPFKGEREKIITAVGRVDANKNHEMIIRAFAQIADEFPEYRLIIYGDGELRSKLLQLIQDLGRADRIELPGGIENVAEAIYKTRVFLLSSNTEGVPNTLIEAMIMGLTVIATDCPSGGPAELIEHGVNGLLVPVGDTDSMKENLQEVLKNLQLADKLCQNASKTAAIYKPERVYGEWKDFLDKLIDGGRK